MLKRYKIKLKQNKKRRGFIFIGRHDMVLDPLRKEFEKVFIIFRVRSFIYIYIYTLI